MTPAEYLKDGVEYEDHHGNIITTNSNIIICTVDADVDIDYHELSLFITAAINEKINRDKNGTPH